jgi:HSP20 family protein
MYTAWNAVSTLDRIFDDVMGSAFGTATSARTFNPSIDIRSNENEVLVILDVPGVKSDDLDVSVENRTLTVKGSRAFDGKENEQVMLGRPYGAFTRTFTLPDTLDGANLSADLAEGVLTVRIPKLAQAKSRRIPIGGGSEPKKLG